MRKRIKNRIKQMVAILLIVAISISQVNVPEAKADTKKNTYITVAKNTYYITKKPSGSEVGEVILMKWGSSGTTASVKQKISYKQQIYKVVGVAGTYQGKKKAGSVFKSTIKKVSLPETITLVGKGTLNGCKKITSFTIPKSVAKVEKGAVNNCAALKKIVVKSRDISFPSSGAFAKISKKAVVYIPTGLSIKDSYKTKVKKQLSSGGSVKYNLSKPEVKAIENGELLENKSVQKDKLTLKGVVFSNSKVKQVAYQITDENGKKIKEGKCKGTTGWELSLSLKAGTNAVKLTAADASGKKGSNTVYIVKVDSEIIYAEDIKAESSQTAQKVAESITEIEEKGDFVYVTVKDDSEILSYVENGALKKGDVYLLRDSEEMPMGFAGIFEGISEENGKKVVKFTPADMEDIYPGDALIDLSGSIDEKNPVAYSFLPDGSQISLNSAKAAPLPVNAGRIGSESNNKFSLFDAITLEKEEKDGIVSHKLEIKFIDTVLYDADGDESTKNDQLKLDGKYSISDFQFDFYFAKKGLSIKQCYNKISYEGESDVKLKVGAKLDAKKAVKFLNGKFDNKKNYKLVQLEGVDLSDTIMVGVVGLNVATMTPFTSSFKTLQKSSEKAPLAPVVFLALIVHLDGTISVEVVSGYDETSYNMKGFNLQKKGYLGKYGPFDASLGKSKELFGYNFQTFNRTGRSKTDMSSASDRKLYLEGEGKASIDFGIGVLGAVMIAGIVPAAFSAYPYGKAEGKIKGRLEISLPMEGIRATGEYSIKMEAGVAGKVAFALTKKMRESIELSTVFWTKTLNGKVPTATEDNKEEEKEGTGDSTDSEGTDTDVGEKGENTGTSGEVTVTEFDPYKISYTKPFIVSAGETCTFYSEENNSKAAVWGYNLGNVGPTIMEVINLDRNGAILSQDMYIRDYVNVGALRWYVDEGDPSGKSIIKVYYGSASIFGFSSANLKNKITGTLETGGLTMENPLSINKEKITLNKGKSFVLKAESKMPEYELKEVKFEVEKSSVASVDANGKVTANKKGTTKITVIGSGGFQKECIVTVK